MEASLGHKDTKTVREEIIATLRERGHTVEDSDVRRIDGCHIPWWVSEDRPGYDGTRGKIRAVVGGEGSQTILSFRKGGINVFKVVSAIETLISRSNAAVAAAQAKNARVARNQPIANKINGDLPGQENSLSSRRFSGSLRGYAGVNNNGNLFVSIDRTCTEEQAREFLAACDRIFAEK